MDLRQKSRKKHEKSLFQIFVQIASIVPLLSLWTVKPLKNKFFSLSGTILAPTVPRAKSIIIEWLHEAEKQNPMESDITEVQKSQNYSNIENWVLLTTGHVLKPLQNDCPRSGDEL